jgi:hypothetical protein
MLVITIIANIIAIKPVKIAISLNPVNNGCSVTPLNIKTTPVDISEPERVVLTKP